MHLSVADHQHLDPARWEMALNLLTVLALDTRCFGCHRDAHIRYHEVPDDFFTRMTKWNPQTQAQELTPFCQFSLKFCISGSISGMLNINNQHDVTIVKEAIQRALATPYTRANRQVYEIDDLLRSAANKGDEEGVERYLEEGRHPSKIAYTYYDLYDKERLQERHALSLKGRRTGLDQEWQTIFDKLMAAGAAIRAGHQKALVGPEPAATMT